MGKIVLKGRKVEKNIISDALFFGLGRTLQELLGTQSGFSALKSIGYNMILYLEENGVKIKIKDKPLETIKNLWKFLVDNGFAESVEIESNDTEFSFVIKNAISCNASGKLCNIYGEINHIMPCPFFILMLAVLGKIGYDISISKEKYKEGLCLLKIKINKIEFVET